ncbi:arsenate reductase (glutaredoxin) [Aureibacter tunicatorum]|uniref:Arsenate reductase n=1 Tax=Aureibacter tunicatorum TaxID=866807 RepID=A0AAE3XJM4_9BACT|nr:arsenate reductase (glutaredoxin) [Aureibacter tunicatorum]MDR6237233.1 arsenate reductase [Aureibacter tunicatorum]BDD06225.1 arsenate reductase [Aureibacter tunicatorum]
MKILHNPRCSKSRQTLEILQDTGSIDKLEIVKYLETPPTADELKEILNKLGIPAKDLIRKGEEIYKTQFKGKELSEEEWIEAMIAYPKLIERPIVIKGDQAVIGRPPEKVHDLL